MLHRRLLSRRPCSSITNTHFRRFRLPRFTFPVPSNEPLAGTGDGSAPFSPLFLLEVGVGLPLALWTYKCLMMILFQRKIIYLPSVPPGTRSESLTERTPQSDALLSGLEWTERTITSSAPTRWLRKPVQLKVIEMEWKGAAEDSGKGQGQRRGGSAAGDSAVNLEKKHVVVVYLQGNAGTPLLRLPLFRRILQPSASSTPSNTASIPSNGPRTTLIAAAPRSFWLSTRSTPTEATVLADYRSVIADTAARYPRAELILYGHSLGGAASILLLKETKGIDGLILENPLPSIPYMVRALYPQRWLPYHWLGPAVFDRWDAVGTLARAAADGRPTNILGRIPSLWIRSGNDEIIPTNSEVKGEEGDGVEKMLKDWQRLSAGDEVRATWAKIDGALHDTAYMSRVWAEEMRRFIAGIRNS